METIKNYLESMFRGLPLTDKVMKAKSELLQMMEDKYTELIRSGKTENEAIGDVIQNFGNLEDLADDLGIQDILHQTKNPEVSRRKLSFEEVTEYIEKRKAAAVMKAFGIRCFIICVIFPILAEALRINEMIGVALMFVSIGMGVICMVMSRGMMENWRFIKEEACSIDAVAIDYVKNKNREFTPTYSVMHSVGILLCVLCFIPAAFFDEIGGHFWDELGGATLFIFVGVGVFLIVFSRSIKSIYTKLLGLNNMTDFSDFSTTNKPEQVKNPTVRAVLAAYWPVVTCIYLCVSFITFKWWITWLIWPIGAAVFTSIIAFSKAREENVKYDRGE